nr:helix-hairpin-helix domain-containing protein [Hahella sp. CCB-MM4]
MTFINSAYAETSEPPIQKIASIEKVNINTADANTIATTLKGIGLKKAEAIVEFRNTNGAFMTIDELALVKGIGNKTVDANRSLIAIK